MRWTRRRRHGGSGARHGAGGVLRLPPLHARAQNDRSTTARPSRSACSGRPAFPSQKRYVVEGQAFYYHNAQHPGAPIKDVVQVFYQFKNEEKAGLGMPMPAGNRPRLPGRFKGRRAVRRRRPHRSHAQGRDAQSEDRQRVRRRLRAEADGLREDRRNVYEVEYEITLRNHKATPVTVEVNEPIGGTLADAAVVAPVGEDGGLRARSSRCL